jgi:hypothetical protein
MLAMRLRPHGFLGGIMISSGYHLIYDYENLYQSFLLASDEKRYKNEILKFNDRLEENLIIS